MNKDALLERIVAKETGIKVAVEAYAGVTNTVVPRPLGDAYATGRQGDTGSVSYDAARTTVETNQGRLYACVWDESVDGGFDDASPD